MKDNHKADVSHTDEFDRMYQEMVKQAEDKYKVKSEHPKTEEEIGLVDNLSSRWVNEFELPNGYIFKDENGNVINATKIVLEKNVLEKKSSKTDDIIKWLREHDMTKYIGVIYSGMCSITFDTEGLIKDFLKMADDDE
jgi:hypothetical protein